MEQHQLSLEGAPRNDPRTLQRLPFFFWGVLHLTYILLIWIGCARYDAKAKSCQNNISGNIVFGDPRAGVNFNDGLGGGSVLSKNLLFNTCSETSQGVFNSWAGRNPLSNQATARAPHQRFRGAALCYLLFMLTLAMMMPSLFHRTGRHTLPTLIGPCLAQSSGM